MSHVSSHVVPAVSNLLRVLGHRPRVQGAHLGSPELLGLLPSPLFLCPLRGVLPLPSVAAGPSGTSSEPLITAPAGVSIRVLPKFLDPLKYSLQVPAVAPFLARRPGLFLPAVPVAVFGGGPGHAGPRCRGVDL
jgi:hypothetical protein